MLKLFEGSPGEIESVFRAIVLVTVGIDPFRMEASIKLTSQMLPHRVQATCRWPCPQVGDWAALT